MTRVTLVLVSRTWMYLSATTPRESTGSKHKQLGKATGYVQGGMRTTETEDDMVDGGPASVACSSWESVDRGWGKGGGDWCEKDDVKRCERGSDETDELQRTQLVVVVNPPKDLGSARTSPLGIAEDS